MNELETPNPLPAVDARTRVDMTYDVSSGGVYETRELPFVVGVLADLSGDNPDKSPFGQRRMLELRRDNFDALMHSYGVSLVISDLPCSLPEQSAELHLVELRFTCLDDFAPPALVRQIPALVAAVETRARLQERAALAAEGPTSTQPESASTLASSLAELDRQLSVQLSAVLHHPRVRQLEATWRALHFLVERAPTSSRVQLRVLDASLRELQHDLSKAVAFDQSKLFKLLYEAEYGTFGGTPYGLLVCAHELDHRAEDLAFLRGMARIAAVAHAPYLCAPRPSLFGLESLRKLQKPRDLQTIFESADYQDWLAFRDSDDARWVAMVLPRMLLRLPHASISETELGFRFEEQLGEPLDPDRFVWGSAAFALADRIVHAFAVHSWPVAIRGPEGGGLIEDLPVYHYMAEDGAPALLGPSELTLPDRREHELRELGFIALCARRGSEQAVFYGAPTLSQPTRYLSKQTDMDARSHARLPHVLGAARLAHYLKVLMRTKIGSFMTAANVEAYLQAWLSQYVLLDESTDAEVMASYPLSEASITVTDLPGRPGAHGAHLRVRLRYQLEHTDAAMQLFLELPAL